MKIIKAGYEIIRPNMDGPDAKNAIYRLIEQAGRTCYKSEDRITPESAAKFVENIVKRGHETMLEHAVMTVKFTVDRGVSHELVRHRLASFAQESTRYCNYSGDKFGNEITVIEPCFFKNVFKNIPDKEYIRECVLREDWKTLNEAGLADDQWIYVLWAKACMESESDYFEMLKYGATPEEARSVLPNSLKTEVVMTANMREWRHFFKLRAAGETGKPHPQMLEVTVPLLNQCRMQMPELFGDIQPYKAPEFLTKCMNVFVGPEE